jgi:hypothetical protein
LGSGGGREREREREKERDSTTSFTKKDSTLSTERDVWIRRCTQVAAALLRLHLKKRELDDMGIQCGD